MANFRSLWFDVFLTGFRGARVRVGMGMSSLCSWNCETLRPLTRRDVSSFSRAQTLCPSLYLASGGWHEKSLESVGVQHWVALSAELYPKFRS